MGAIFSELSFVLAVIFAAAGALKVRRLPAFLSELGDYQILPQAWVRPVAVAIPLAEVAGAVLTVVPATHRFGLVVLFALLAVFTAAITRNLIRGRTAINCACFGASRTELTWGMVMRNTLLALIAVGALAAGEQQSSLAAVAGSAVALAIGALAVEGTRNFTSQPEPTT